MLGLSFWSVCSGLGLFFSPVGCPSQVLACLMLPWRGFHLEVFRIPVGAGVWVPLMDPLVLSPGGPCSQP